MISEATVFRIVQELAAIIACQRIQLSARASDGRTNSIENEKDVLSQIRNLSIAGLVLQGHQVGFDIGKDRHWYDFALLIRDEDAGLTVRAPVNIKVSALSGADNLSAKLSLFYALTGIEPSFPDSIGWNDFLRTLKDFEGAKPATDYYYLVVEKGAGTAKRVFAQSLKRIGTLVPNGNNLPFQCNWSENLVPVERSFQEARDYIIATLGASFDKRAEQSIAFNEIFRDSIPADPECDHGQPDPGTLAHAPVPAADHDVVVLGQVFTPEHIVHRMIGLIANRSKPDWRCLEPSCGDGAFLRKIPGCVGIELDARHCPAGAINTDFFAYEDSAGFDTIIGNPPFVRFQDIHPDTRARLDMTLFNERSNLYMFFIDRCLSMLRPGGELIFINPREFLKGTSAQRLNARIFAEGTITDIVDLGDERVFGEFSPNCVIWRFEKGNFSRTTNMQKRFGLQEGQLLFTRTQYPFRVSDFFDVRVGGVTGADKFFAGGKVATRDFVCSKTIDDGKTRKMIYADDLPAPPAALLEHKEALLARQIRAFDETNWWHWGRRPIIDPRPRVYVNCKTRRPEPFFLHDSLYFDGAVMALILKDVRLDPHELAQELNSVDWDELGFRSGGRFLFQQRSLQNAPLPESFGRFLTTSIDTAA